MTTKEEQIEILSEGDDLLRHFYANNDSDRELAWARVQEAETHDHEHPLPAVNGHQHPDDVLIATEDVINPDFAQEEDDVSALLDNIDIIEAYQRWCGKMSPDPGGKRESIMISCPNPSHPDRNPSAWINLDKQVWVCGGCGFEGGDKFDIAAWHFGYGVPDYKNGKNFPDLRRKMAEDLGYIIKRTRSGEEYLIAPVEEAEEDPADVSARAQEPDNQETQLAPRDSEPDNEITRGFGPEETGTDNSDDDEIPVRALPGPDLDDMDDLELESVVGADSTGSVDEMDPPPSVPDPPSPATVTRIYGDDPLPPPPKVDIEKLRGNPLFIDWEDFGLEGTFLGDWMQGSCVDHSPDEYLFWMGMQCLGFGVSMNALMDDPMALVKPALYVVLYGGTGSGKSRAMSAMRDVLHDVLPSDSPDGVRRVGTPGSGEALIDSTIAKLDVTGGMVPEEVEHKRIWFPNDEFGTLTTIANRKGSTLKTALMEFYDLISGTPRDEVTIYSRGTGTVSARNKFLQVTSGVQPKVLGTYTSDTDVMSGFLNRFTFAMGPSRRTPVPMPPYRTLGGAVSRLTSIRDWADDPHRLRMTPTASNTWSEFFMEEISPALVRSMKLGSETETSMSDAFTARTELTLKKLCLFFAINEESEAVEDRHVLQATRLAPYLRASMVELNGDFIWTFSTAVEEAILHYLRMRGTQKTRMKQITGTLAKRFPRNDLKNALRTLIELGVVEEQVIKSKRGPSSTVYNIAGDDEV